jgi:hypothetical protein
MNNYFIYGVLPPLEFGVRADISSRDITELFDLNFSKNDLKKVHVLKLWIDIANIYGLFGKSNFDSRGNYSKSTIKALIANEEDLPAYVFEFFQAHEKDEERKKYFPQLIARYFAEEKKKSSGYLLNFLTFEHDLRVLLSGFRAKNLGLDLAKELQFEDMSNEIVSFVLMQKDRGGKFQFPLEYEDLERVLEEAGRDPSKQYQEIARYRFKFYINYFTKATFSLEGILAYMIALWILEDFFALNREEGENFLSNIVERGNVS